VNKWSILLIFEDSQIPLNPHSAKVLYTSLSPTGEGFKISGFVVVVSWELIRNDISTATPMLSGSSDPMEKQCHESFDRELFSNTIFTYKDFYS
jgi:hypothetical protein